MLLATRIYVRISGNSYSRLSPQLILHPLTPVFCPPPPLLAAQTLAKNIENLFIVKYGTLHLFAAGRAALCSCPQLLLLPSSCFCCTLSTLFYVSVRVCVCVCVCVYIYTTNACYCCSSWGVKMIECLNSTFVLPRLVLPHFINVLVKWVSQLDLSIPYTH